MKYWLVKSEPGCWSFTDHQKKGIEPWDGVRNHQAANNLKAMAVGDQAFFYHSVKEKAVVGLLEVVQEAYPDVTDASGKFVTVDFKALNALPQPVYLKDIKQDPRLEKMALLKQSRLSVMPITPDEWHIICALGGLEQ